MSGKWTARGTSHKCPKCGFSFSNAWTPCTLPTLTLTPLKRPFNDDHDNIYRLDSIVSQRNWYSAPKYACKACQKTRLGTYIENCNMTVNHFVKICRSPKDKFNPKALPLRKTTHPRCIHEIMMIMWSIYS